MIIEFPASLPVAFSQFSSQTVLAFPKLHTKLTFALPNLREHFDTIKGAESDYSPGETQTGELHQNREA